MLHYPTNDSPVPFKNKYWLNYFVAGGKNYKRDSAYMGSSLQINSHNSNSLGRKMGTWFTFGSNKKTRHHDQTSWDKTTLL